MWLEEAKFFPATMEEIINEVDVKTLFHDEAKKGSPTRLPRHGPLLRMRASHLRQQRTKNKAAKTAPFTVSCVLAQWDEKAPKPEVVLRNQFTEITEPNGIYGSDNPATDPIWSIGWDSRSLTLMCLNKGEWHRYRLPKAGYSYDGAKGWNTAWPRMAFKLNGILIHDNRELPKDNTTAALGKGPLKDEGLPVYLQNHGNPVVFRNIWVLPK